MTNILFNDDNYPKSYASSDKGDYRLRDFLTLPREELKNVEGQLWNFIYDKTKKIEPLRKYQNYQFRGAGWEWSVFKKDVKTVVKIPAQVFEEVNEAQYLENTKIAYYKILNYFPSKYVARSKFYRDAKINIIEQELVNGDDSFFISFNTRKDYLFNNLKLFLHYAQAMLKNEEWLPDFDIKGVENGFNIRNVIFEGATFIPKIIDFTSYYDVYRLYPERTAFEVKEKSKRINNFLEWLENKNVK